MKLFKYTKDPILLIVFRWLLVIIFLEALIITVSFFVSWQPFEVIVSFLPQILIIMSGMVMLLITIGARFVIRDGFRITKNTLRVREVTGFALSIALLLVVVQGALFGSISALEKESVFGTTVKVATYNKFIHNTEINGIQAIARRNVDIVTLQEASLAEAQDYQRILQMDHIVSTDCGCSAGGTEVHILSHHPITDFTVIDPHSNGAIAHATIEHPAVGTLSVYGVHLTPPFTQHWHERRTVMFDALSAAVAQDTNPTFVMGDFNTTIYSPVFRDFARQVEDSVELVLDKNWPQCSRYENRIQFSIACVRIDHILIPNSTAYTGSVLLKDTNSDHLPFIANVVFPEL